MNWKFAHFESSRGAAIKHFFIFCPFSRKTFDTPYVIYLGQTVTDVREREACWRLKDDDV